MILSFFLHWYWGVTQWDEEDSRLYSWLRTQDAGRELSMTHWKQVQTAKLAKAKAGKQLL